MINRREPYKWFVVIATAISMVLAIVMIRSAAAAGGFKSKY